MLVEILKVVLVKAEKKMRICHWKLKEWWSYYIVAESLEFCQSVMQKAILLSVSLRYLQRKFPSKVLKVQPGSFLLLTVKCEKKEMN